MTHINVFRKNEEQHCIIINDEFGMVSMMLGRQAFGGFNQPIRLESTRVMNLEASWADDNEFGRRESWYEGVFRMTKGISCLNVQCPDALWLLDYHDPFDSFAQSVSGMMMRFRNRIISGIHHLAASGSTDLDMVRNFVSRHYGIGLNDPMTMMRFIANPPPKEI